MKGDECSTKQKVPPICLVPTFQKIMENNVNEKCSGKCSCKILSIIAIVLSVISIIFSSIVLVRGNRRPREFFGKHPSEIQGYIWENNYGGNHGGNFNGNQGGNRNWNNNNNFDGNRNWNNNNNFSNNRGGRFNGNQGGNNNWNNNNFGGNRGNGFNNRPGQSNNNSTNNGLVEPLSILDLIVTLSSVIFLIELSTLK